MSYHLIAAYLPYYPITALPIPIVRCPLPDTRMQSNQITCAVLCGMGEIEGVKEKKREEREKKKKKKYFTTD